MKKAIIMLAAMVLLAVPAFADVAAGLVDVTRVTGYYSGNGGEFTLDNSAFLDTSAYSTATKNKAGPPFSFQTFCIETNEYIMPPYTARVVISDTAVNESTGLVGLPGSGSHAVLGSKPKGDNLSPLTAYLYTKFAQGTLSNYIWTPGVGRSTSAAALQNAIWYIEEEPGILLASGQATTWYNEAVTANWTGIGGVRVLNLYDPDTGVRAQDQLYLVPAPAAIGLGLIGLALVGWVKRRLA
jgi:hypothetical protein